MRAGLYAAVAMAAIATWLSLDAGYPVETALLRGLLAFMGGSLVAYFAELVVMTAPPARARPARAAEEGLYDDLEGDGDGEHGEDDESMDGPASLPAIRSEREAAADGRQAA